MSKDSKKSDLEKYGISITSNSIKKEITQKDLEKALIKEIGNTINVKIDNDGKSN